MKSCVRVVALTAAAFLCAAGAFAQPAFSPTIVDYTPGPPAQDVPEALADLALPEGWADRLTEVYAGEGDIRSVQVAWLSPDRYLWRIDLAEALPEGETLNLYLNADADEATGRADAGGAEIMAQWGPDSSRLTEWMADNAITDNRGLRTAVDGTTLWATLDVDIPVTDGAARFVFWITIGDGGLLATEASVPAEPPRPVRFEAGKEVGGDLTLSIDGPTQVGPAAVFNMTLINTGGTERWIDFSFDTRTILQAPVNWFDGFNFTPHTFDDQPLRYHGTSAVTPLTCAWSGEDGLAMAFDPLDWYTEAHSGIEPGTDGAVLQIGSRIALAPHEVQKFNVHVFPFDGSVGWRGAFEAYWNMHPDLYHRARDIDPRFNGPSAGGLYRSWTDPASEEFASDLIRRMHGHWEWGYAPAPRPGEWAVTDLSTGTWENRSSTKTATAESLEESRRHIRTWVHDTAEKADVAVAYYMHLKNVEKGLMEQYWSDSYFQNTPIEYVGYYAGVPCWFAYPWANRYGAYLQDSIPVIVRRFGPAGVAFDSVFGFIPHWGPSADKSPGTTFENGRAFVGEGIGFAEQMDVVREQQSGDYRTAMVTNLKLPTLSADAVRTDTALLEFHPMNNPSYRERILRLRMLSGQIGFNWWHTYDPRYYKWIPWDDLNDQQTIDAFRRLRDDVLIHSLYYGGVPNARFAAGVPKIMRAIPMLNDIADEGWQPVIGASSDADLLLSRFGDGLGMGIGVGNQTYNLQQGSVVLDERAVAGAQKFAFATWGDEPTETDLNAPTPSVGVSVPPRDVKGLRVIVALPRDRAAKAFVTGENALPVEQWRKHVPGSWQIDLGGVRPAGPIELGVWLPEHAANVTATANGRAAQVEVDGSVARMTVGGRGDSVELVVSWQPRVALQGDRDALLDYEFTDDGRPNCNVVAAGGTHDLAFRVQEYFREYYRWALAEPQTVKLPIVSTEQAPDGRRVVVGLASDMPDDLQIDLGDADGAFGVQGDVVYATATTPEMLAKAVEGLLFTLDERYEWWGPYYPTQHFFRGDPANAPEALQQAGMAGKTLTGEDTGSLREVTDLPELIEW